MSMKSKLAFILQKRIIILFLLIISLAGFLRIYKLGQVPPSLTWDEAAVGYNAWTIANYGRDEYGRSFPIYFKSFGEDKQPVHIYLTAIIVKLFGPSEFTIRLPAALFGIFNIALIFFLAQLIFRNNLIALTSSFFLAISPQNIHFSRFNHEANFALFFFMLGLIFFLKFIKEDRLFLSLALLSLLFSMICYHAAEIIVPPIIILLIIIYKKSFKIKSLSFFISLFLLFCFIVIVLFQPRLFGIARLDQTAFSRGDIEKTQIFKLTGSYTLGRVNRVVSNYWSNFNPQYLFVKGDNNPRLSSQGAGEFYKIDALFLLIGVFSLIKKRSKEGIFLLGWAFIAPFGDSIAGEAPHAARAYFMMGSWNLIAALGFYKVVSYPKRYIFKWFNGVFVIAILLCSLIIYLNYYFNEFPKRYAIDWQYGMKQVVEFVTSHNEYDQVYMTSIRSQPYIFYLYYLKTPLYEYLNTVVYNNNREKSSNNVSYFGKYSFEGWNAFESKGDKGVLYVLSPSEYDGLKYRSSFDIKKVVYFPNNTVAFFIVALN